MCRRVGREHTRNVIGIPRAVEHTFPYRVVVVGLDSASGFFLRAIGNVVCVFGFTTTAVMSAGGCQRSRSCIGLQPWSQHMLFVGILTPKRPRSD